jgi:hypothetical protein
LVGHSWGFSFFPGEWRGRVIFRKVRWLFCCSDVAGALGLEVRFGVSVARAKDRRVGWVSAGAPVVILPGAFRA